MTHHSISKIIRVLVNPQAPYRIPTLHMFVDVPNKIEPIVIESFLRFKFLCHLTLKFFSLQNLKTLLVLRMFLIHF